MTKIEWTELTWNPVTGCTKISEGCQNCYAEKMHKRLQAMGQGKYYYPFERISYFSEELNKSFGKTSKKIFVNSMSDLFHISVSDVFINQVLWKIQLNNMSDYKHIFQILTKRSERLREFKPEAVCGYKDQQGNYIDIMEGKFPSNVWLGVSVELAKYKNRIDDLRATNAKVKFISFEPLLGDVGELNLSGIDWVIVGGESGHKARPCHPDWVRNIQRQCQEQNVPFFFKQWGEWAPDRNPNENDLLDARKEIIISPDGRKTSGIMKYDTKTDYVMRKVGKKKAGCLLDGREYKEYPVKNLEKRS